ncbi:four helix bundle protein [Candidatus Parcubacteria bacterium]|nr:MAG: four helix bundle protein [Candidatus Parcubacteria bacterium]
MAEKGKTFEDILAWQKAQLLARNIYKLFRHCNDASFKDQICRASVSVSNNIAEGYEKCGNKDYTKFLYIAKGSCGEVRSMIHLAKDLKYVSKNNFDKIYEQSTEVSKMIYGIIKHINKK